MLIAARELAGLRHGVFLLGHGVARESTWDGIRLVDFQTAEREGAPDVDVVVTLNRLMNPKQLSRFGSPRYLHWHQNDALSPYGRNLVRPEMAGHVERFVFVSHSQAAAYAAHHGLGPGRMDVIPNPVAPQFCDLFARDAEILAAKDENLLVYASSPNRGLDGLLRNVFPSLRAARPGLRLEAYAGFQMSHRLGFVSSENEPSTDYISALLDVCNATEHVLLQRGVPKPRQAQTLRHAQMLCYPCTYRETCCVTALEAMAAGCQVSTTDLGALRETTAGYAYVTRPRIGQAVEVNVSAFVPRTLSALEERDRRPQELEQKLRRQIAYVMRNHHPAVVGRLWQRILTRAAAPGE